MVNMVNNQMVGSGHYHPVHLETFGPGTSGGVKSATVGVDEPLEFRQPVVIVGIDEGEFALCKGDPAGRFGACFGKPAGAEIGATCVKRQGPPLADEGPSAFSRG